MSTLNIGAKLMQYRIVDVLGAGGFGVTYLAKDEMLEKLFAIKEYFPEDFAQRKGMTVKAKTGRDDDFAWSRERFIEEARILAKFKHPNIVDVTQIFEANNTAYLVLEYQRGRNFKEWLDEIGDSPAQPELDCVVEPILNALEVIHRNNVLHRDIAPNNIYIRDDGSPVLLDFGSAREAIAQRTKTVSALVKSGYSPIEQYSASGGGQGPWSDIYAFAATLYLCVTGSAPEEATERLIADQYVTAANAAKAQYRKSFLEAIDWGLRLLPKDRPQSVDQWQRALLQDGGKSELSGNNNVSSGKVIVLQGEDERPGLGILLQRRHQAALAFLIAILALGFGLYQNMDKVSSIFLPRSQVAAAVKQNNESAAAPALAKQPKPETKPAAQKTQPAEPAAPAPAAPAPQAAAAPPQLMYSPWLKVCGKGPETNNKQVCVLTKDGRLENGTLVAIVQLFEPEGEAKVLRVTVPLGMQLEHGTRMIIDQGQPAKEPYKICFPVGCMSDYPVTDDIIAKMKKGQTITLQAINMQGTPISMPLPLNDFAKAYDGPPTDPRVVEEQQRKLKQQLQK